MKKIISLMLAIVLCMGLVPIAAVADETPAQTPITYLDKHGNEQTCDNYTELTADTGFGRLSSGWYVVKEKFTVDTFAFIQNPSETFNLILCDGAELTISRNMSASGNLTIYGQKKGTGKLVVNGGIDSGIHVRGDLVINGGDITAKINSGSVERYSRYAIGATNVTINGGTVTATTGDIAEAVNTANYYGISADSVLIKNATVTATGADATADSVAAESCGIYAKNGNVRIFNSTVTATGGNAQGDGDSQSCGIYAELDIDIEDSTVVASADKNSTNYNALRANGGEIHCENADLSFSASPIAKLRGSFKKVIVTESVIGLNEYLEDGYAFYDADGKVVNGASLSNVSVQEHEHNFETDVTSHYMCACGAGNTTQSVAYVDYVDGEAVTKYTTDYEVVTNATTKWTPGKTYVVNSTVTIDSTVQNGSGTGDIKLILCDGAELKVNDSIVFNDRNLTIYGQEKGTGELTAICNTGDGIYMYNKDLTINGGVINATGGSGVAGSCGINSVKATGYNNPVRVIINGGKLTATGGTATTESCGIKANELEINGGKVTAGSNELQNPAYGIYTYGATTITGGEITLNTESYLTNANISGGEFKGSGELEIWGEPGDVSLSGGSFEIKAGFYYQRENLTCFSDISKLLVDGYAVFDEEDGLTTAACTSLRAGESIKEHECKYVKDENAISDRYECDCGRATRTKPISYIDENGDTKWCLDYSTVSSEVVSDSYNPARGSTLWDVYDKDLTRTEKLKIETINKDTVLNIILCDGVDVNFPQGIFLEGSDSNAMARVNIYAQSTGDKAGKLTIDKGIERGVSYNCSVTVNGGDITVNADTSTQNGAAINAGYFTLNGGTLTTNATNNGVFASYSATVNGGTLNANSTTDYRISAIASGEDITITGGTFNIGSNDIFAENILMISDKDFALPKNSQLGSLEISSDVTLKSLLPSGCAFTQWEKVDDGNEIGNEEIGYVPLSSKTPLVRYWADEEYCYIVIECDEHSGSPCAYCGYKKRVTGGSEPTLTPSVTQPATGGKIEISNNAPTAGEVITVTPKADDGYTVSEIIVKDSSGNTVEVTKNADGSYSFTQPDTEVTVEVSFKPMTSFKDVKSGDWYESAVNFVVANGIMNGVSENYFYPNFKITRGMFATVLYNLAGKPEVEITNVYSDVKSTEYYAAPIAWATEQGIVNGMPSGKFLPNEPITREQMVKMLWVYLGSPEATGDLSRFPDGNKVSDYAQTAMAWAVENGVITGRANGTLDPRGTATRAEAARIFENYLDK